MDETPAQSPDNSDGKPISLKSFLESVHPNVPKEIEDVWANVQPVNASKYMVLRAPPLLLHCVKCDGERNFRCDAMIHLAPNTVTFTLCPTYRCGDCRETLKTYSIHLVKKADGKGTVTKFGEIPPFGTPVPNRVLNLFGKDRDLFLKGRKCENQGLGVAAHAYYRRVVENHRNDIFDSIIRVCETLGPSTEQLIIELRQAKEQVSFTSSMDAIKSMLPQGLLINGRNPLLVLHSALSIGIHKETDETCLSTAHAIRMVLTALVERMAIIRDDNSELHQAVEFLLNNSRALPQREAESASAAKSEKRGRKVTAAEDVAGQHEEQP